MTGKERVIDAYCGTGTIGIIASGNARDVIGVELNRDAIRDARMNARENKIRNVRFVPGDAGWFMEGMAAEGEKVEVVLMDPPRSGSDRKFLHSLLTLSPEKIVYVSCNPETLARDLACLTKRDYLVKKMQPVDMFPLTDSVEVVCFWRIVGPDREELDFWQLTVICDAKRRNKKRMDRTVYRKLQPLFKNGSKFLKHGRTANYINSRNLIAL